MNISRRAAIATLGLGVMPGCRLLSEQPCMYACVNLTGGWIAGVCEIGKAIGDYIVSPPNSANENSARTSIVSGYHCKFSGFDQYSKEKLELSGKVPRVPSGLEDPYLLLYLKRNSQIECEWKDLIIAPSGLEIAISAPENTGNRPLLVLAPQNARTARASFRQRPQPSGGTSGSTWATQPKGTVQNSLVLYLSPENESPHMILCFTDGYLPDEGPSWRTFLDLREIPKGRTEETAYWLETKQDGTFRLGRFQAPTLDRFKLLHLYAEKKLTAPKKFLVGQAKQHPRFNITLHNGKTSMLMPDLRFPDEM